MEIPASNTAIAQMVGDATVAKAWGEYGVQPWRSETFKYSTDPALMAKVTQLVGLYTAPPESATRVRCRRQERCRASVTGSP